MGRILATFHRIAVVTGVWCMRNRVGGTAWPKGAIGNMLLVVVPYSMI